METTFQIGDFVEAEWADGHKSIHRISKITAGRHVPFYHFMCCEKLNGKYIALEQGLHGCYLRKLEQFEGYCDGKTMFTGSDLVEIIESVINYGGRKNTPAYDGGYSASIFIKGDSNPIWSTYDGTRKQKALEAAIGVREYKFQWNQDNRPYGESVLASDGATAEDRWFHRLGCSAAPTDICVTPKK